MRNEQLIRWTRYICRMLDGRSRSTDEFMDLAEGMHIRTLRRDLEGLASVPELQIATINYEGIRYWRMTARLIPDPIARIKTKYCPKCDKTKPIEEFNRQRGSADGRKSACGLCTSEMKREWAKRNKKRINAYRRRRRKLKHLTNRQV